MSTNQERRAEARQRLREQMEAQARREKQLKIAAASTVAILLLGLVGVVVWNKQQEARAEQHAADWLTCEYPEAPNETPEKITGAQAEELIASGQADQEQIDDYNKDVDEALAAKDKEKIVAAPEGEQPRRGTAEVVLSLDSGDVPITLDRSKAPCNVSSMVNLIESGYLDDNTCHRLAVAKGDEGLSVLQCGDPTGTGAFGPGYTVVDEPPADLPVSQDGSGMSVYPRGTVAIANTGQPDSGGGQFFLVYKDSTLPPNYAVVGNLAEEGLTVIEALAENVPDNSDKQPQDQKPRRPIAIEKATVLSQDGLPES